MSDSPNEDRGRAEEIEEHEGVDAETVFEDVGELFAPDNTEIPAPSPDAPPP